jgi:transcriptional regulator with XRE-family HTH domain
VLGSLKSGKEYRHAFVEEKVRTSIAAQIYAMRTRAKGGMTQPEFARRMGKSQSWVSRLEDPNQPAPTIASLLKVAEAFDVDLEIRFGSFSTMLRRLDEMTPESLEAPSFTEELEAGAFRKRRKPDPTVDEIADKATRREDISAHFTNRFAVVRPRRSRGH